MISNLTASFHNGGKWQIPSAFLSSDELAILKQKGRCIRENGKIDCKTGDNPLIFYNHKKDFLYGHEISVLPLYLLLIPYTREDTVYYLHKTNEEKLLKVEAARQLERDLTDFPLDFFYTRLHSLKDISIEPNITIKEQGLAFRSEKKIKIDISSNDFKIDYKYAANLILHELYHFVEFKLNERVEELFFSHERWSVKHYTDFLPSLYGKYLEDIRTGRTKRKEGDTYNFEWKNKESAVGTPGPQELAELLSALTIINHPEILNKIHPYYDTLMQEKQVIFP